MPLETQFAPAERTDQHIIEELSVEVGSFVNNSHCLDALPNAMIVLNKDRQIVFANKAFLALAGVAKVQEVIGMRPGEAVHCNRAHVTEQGCGTSEFCRTCGAVQAILTSQDGAAAVNECRINQAESDAAFDLRVWANPMDIHGARYTIFSINDVSNEKRRKTLERIFFHDILNTAGGLIGLAELEKDEVEGDEFANSVYSIASNLVDEIRAQKELTAAENNELTVKLIPLQSSSIMSEVLNIYKSHPTSTGKHLAVEPSSENITMVSDRTVLSRIVGNMVKNALEASREGDHVSMASRSDGKRVRFSVSNPGFIPRDTQLQIFQRSFSTKGAGRGLGTYSIKLLTERYLKGTVSFESSPDSGTIFWVVIPERI